MPVQIRFSEKPLLTNGAWERFLFQMCITVALVVVLVHKPFSTYLAYKRKLFLMALHMQLIIICQGELFPTLFLFASYKNLLL